MFRLIAAFLLLGATTQLYATSVDENTHESTPTFTHSMTPQNLSLNAFGQWVIGWGTGPEGARQRLDYIQREDVVIIKQKGTTLEMIRAWQQYYENEVQNNANNPTARYRARLMKKIADLW
ncbi:DUF4951 domain-containing protein [Acinetobacter haemolyticus]|uniref:DUF4951 domain-containing protein n=1 Tax=Acinetobacter haemolyticus TaxID=29430 RepID=A0A4P7B7K1_ACIHA|nr:DUF4951 domain-containing protein [Acinetobacter haemolyticus]NAR63654.1 DUF4951 domain-containing protein [Acinetobacter haemolyticus]NAR75834.1 DUF4951 domain-containing protein [Acinetobacter haemolyticus]NCU24963.1 DUF4951 domain-containing protein [Acinetobacter haemolyticus]QBQ17043.1 DUF4951 domain-containing protein [Acinetobacter haemolyticus]